MSNSQTHIRSRRLAFSLIELILVISILGIIAGMLLPKFIKLREGALRSRTEQVMEKLNVCVANHNAVFTPLEIVPKTNSAQDEISVINSIQGGSSNDTNNISYSGSHCFDDAPKLIPSNGAGFFRIYWNGENFKLLKKGKAGTGLIISASNS